MKRIILFSIIYVMMSFIAKADGYWLELDGTGRINDTLTIRVRYGGVNDNKTRYINKGTALDKMKDFQLCVTTPTGKRIPVEIKQQNDCWVACFVPSVNGIFQISAIDTALPVVERMDSLQNIKPVQYLCTAYKVGTSTRTETKPAMYLYLNATVKNDTATIIPSINGKRIASGTMLRVFYPNNEDGKIIVTEQGTTTLALTSKGTYLIRLDSIARETGIIDNKKYFTKRHRCDYTLVIK